MRRSNRVTSMRSLQKEQAEGTVRESPEEGASLAYLRSSKEI